MSNGKSNAKHTQITVNRWLLIPYAFLGFLGFFLLPEHWIAGMIIAVFSLFYALFLTLQSITITNKDFLIFNSIAITGCGDTKIKIQGVSDFEKMQDLHD